MYFQLVLEKIVYNVKKIEKMKLKNEAYKINQSNGMKCGYGCFYY